MARTPVASRNTQNTIFSDGYEGNHSRELIASILGGEENFRSPIDLVEDANPYTIRRRGDVAKPAGNFAIGQQPNCRAGGPTKRGADRSKSEISRN